MPNFNKFFFFLIAFSIGIHSEDFDTPYEINSGDTNSSELANYQNQNIKDSLKTWSNADLIGKWTCSGFGDAGDWSAIGGSNSGTTTTAPSYTFPYNGSPGFVVNSKGSGLITRTGADNMTWNLFGNVLFFSRSVAVGWNISSLEFLAKSKTRFIINVSIDGGGANKKFVEICDKTHSSSNPDNTDSGTWVALPISNHPTNLTVNSLENASRTLSWTDNSSNETGFKIFRKKHNTAFSLIAATAADATSYIDATFISGDQVLFYKVVPTNASGDGKPSKVVRIRYNDPTNP